MGISPDLGYDRTTDLVTELGSSPGRDVTMVPSGSKGHLDQQGPYISMALRH